MTKILQIKLKKDKIRNKQKRNTIFSNTVKNLKIPEREQVNPFADKLLYVILEVIFKYSKHLTFVFKEIKKSEHLKLPSVI